MGSAVCTVTGGSIAREYEPVIPARKGKVTRSDDRSESEYQLLSCNQLLNRSAVLTPDVFVSERGKIGSII